MKDKCVEVQMPHSTHNSYRSCNSYSISYFPTAACPPCNSSYAWSSCSSLSTCDDEQGKQWISVFLMIESTYTQCHNSTWTKTIHGKRDNRWVGGLAVNWWVDWWVGWSVVWWVGRLIDWLIDWLVNWWVCGWWGGWVYWVHSLVDGWTGWVTDELIGWLVGWFGGWCVCVCGGDWSVV